MEKVKNDDLKGNSGLDRRKFISRSALAAIGTVGSVKLLSSCSGGQKKKEIKLPTLLTQAPDGKVLKAGLIG